jgi:Peptidase inhibitor I9
MIMFHHRRQMILSILSFLLLVTTLVNAQIVEQDDAGRVIIRGEEDDRTQQDNNSSRGNDDENDNEETTETITDEVTIAIDGEGDDQPVAGTEVQTFQQAWVHYFKSVDDTDVEDMKLGGGAFKDGDIQGTKDYIIVYRQPSDFSIAEEILAATDAAVQSTVVDNGGSINYEYTAAFNGVAASLTNEAMVELMQQDGIEFIEEVVPMYTMTTWGQDRVDEKDLTPATLDYVWKRNRSAGVGVNVCVRYKISLPKGNSVALLMKKLPSLLNYFFCVLAL